MNFAWASSLDQFWLSPAFPMWLTLAAGGFFGIIVLVTVLRAEKSVANGALTVITLLAIGIAVAATIRGFVPDSQQSASVETRTLQPMGPALPALSCIDDLAGDLVTTGCEKALFGSAESTAAAVSYAALQITRLTALGDVATANKSMTPELQALRRAVEHDRYGLVAQVLAARDHCTAAECAAFRSLTDSHQVASNIDGHVYDGLVSRYAPLWNAPPPTAPVALLSSMPTGRPTNAEFPTAASTPPVSIMTPEPGTGSAPPAAARGGAPGAAAPLPLAHPTPAPAPVSAKKPPAPKPPRVAAPVQIAPAAPAPAAAPTPAASND
jgi:hypothetical protein